MTSFSSSSLIDLYTSLKPLEHLFHLYCHSQGIEYPLRPCFAIWHIFYQISRSYSENLIATKKSSAASPCRTLERPG